MNLQLDNTVHISVDVENSHVEDSSFRQGPIRLYIPEDGPSCDFSLRPVNIGEFNSRYQALREQITSSPGKYLEKKQLMRRTETNVSS